MKNRKIDVNVNSGGLGLLGIMFIVLKLVGVIDWSWWWVLFPFYGPLVIVIVISAAFVLWQELAK